NLDSQSGFNGFDDSPNPWLQTPLRLLPLRATLIPMHLAKQHLDIGLFSTRRDEQLAFWQHTVGLAYDHMGKLGGGMQQHRHHMNGSILKMNHSRHPLPEAPPSGLLGLQIAKEGVAGQQ